MMSNISLLVCVLLPVGLVVAAAFGQQNESPQTQPATTPSEKNPQVVMETSMGQIVIELYPDKAPVTVENFLRYVDEKHYDGTIFHRVIKRFMIQGGGYTQDMRDKETHAPIKNEAANGLKNKRGTLAMARTSEINSATDQFFINTQDNSFLDHGTRDYGYAVFGKVVEGMDVVDKIESVQTGAQDRPTKPVIIKSVTRK